MANKVVEASGSINFQKNGGICGNFSPCQSCCFEWDNYHLAGDSLHFGEEPGPGGCAICPLACCFLGVGFYCLMSSCIISSKEFCDNTPCLPFYCCCGACGPVNFRGITFSTSEHKVQCELRTKHCCTEAEPILLSDVLDFRIIESRRVHHSPTNATPEWIAVIDKIEILHRDASTGQLMIYSSNELKRPRHVDILRVADPHGSSIISTMMAKHHFECGPTPPSGYAEYETAARTFITTTHSKHKNNGANRMTFLEVDGNAHLKPHSTELPDFHNKQAPAVEGNRPVMLMNGGDKGSCEGNIVQALVIGEYSTKGENYTCFEVNGDKDDQKNVNAKHVYELVEMV